MSSGTLNIRAVAAVIIFIPFILGASGCPNALNEFAQKDTDPALLYQAEMLMDQRDYTGAIATIDQMTTAGKAKRATKIVLGAAYAGACGVDLISLAEAIADGTASGQKLFQILLSTFKGATPAHVVACKNAESTMLSIASSADERTADESVLLAFAEFAKIGAIFANSGADDLDDDGVVDGDFVSCTADPAHIEDADVQEIGTGITIAMASLSGTGVAGDITTSFATMCATIDTLLGSSGFCDQQSTDDFDAMEIKGLRSLIKANEIGFDTCGGATGSSLACSCP